MGPAIIQRNADAAMRILGKSMFPLEKQSGVLFPTQPLAKAPGDGRPASMRLFGF